MCGTCGCGQPEAGAGRPHRHDHDAHHEGDARRLSVERSILEDNALGAERLRKHLAARGIEAIGLLGGPGAGKTTLLEATLDRLGDAAAREAVIEGDCATERDAERIAARGARVTQVVTGSLCHLDAHLVEHAAQRLDLDGVTRLWVENVGNLVCPAPFACGESRRALLVSVAEGDDKPAKYPAAIAAVDLLLITKTDLLPYVDFDLGRCIDAAHAIRPDLTVLTLSARTGEGLDAWLDWVRQAGG